MAKVQENLERVREQIAQAAAKAGRGVDEIEQPSQGFERKQCSLGCRYLVIAIIPERISRVVLAMEIAAVVEVIYCANVLREEKVQCPVKRHTNLFVQAGQFTQVNRPPHPPGGEAREIEAKDPRHTHPTPD